MGWRAWAILGAAGAFVGYEVLKYTVNTIAACILVGLLLALWAALAIFYRCRLSRLRQRLSKLPPEDKRRVLNEIDPDVAADLQKGKKSD